MRIIIADDDDYTREGLIDSIEWEQFGISNILEARDGAEALRLATQYKPEIVLTDIRMPKLNGIDFAEKLGEHCPDSKLLFMSGYLDVDYLKSAIRLSAVDYIEKPIKLPELQEAIRKTVQSVHRSKRLINDLSTKKNLQQQKLARLLIEGTVDPEWIRQQCEEAKFPVNSSYLCLLVYSPRQAGHVPELLEYVKAFWSEQGVHAVGDHLGKEEFVFVLALNRLKMDRIEVLAKQLIQRSEHQYVGIGSRVSSLFELNQSYANVQKALDQFFYYPDLHYYPSQEWHNAQSGISPQLFVDFYMLMKSQPSGLMEWIDSVCRQFTVTEHPPREQVYSLFSSLGRAIIQEKGALLAKLDGIYDINDVDVQISEFTTLEEIRVYIQGVCKIYCTEIDKDSKYSHTITNVMNYIASHVGKVDLDLLEIGQHMFMSPAHLNMLFKQDTGTTITQYIRDYRIELAKKLIMNEHYKMNAISELCGFASPSYFAKVFRICTSVTPVEFRKMKLR
ncbi:response regulator [Paenibacillus sp. FSL M7-0896]|uniref:response regulator n=1 Tax=Paenibacillus sp. FSL M7-0896 TaxID=2921610 RepID=UPI0030D794BC